MVRALLAHDRGAAAVSRQVRVPTVEEEEHQRLVKERTSPTHAIRGLLHGIFDLQPRSKAFEAGLAGVKTAGGEPFPHRARQEIQRIAQVADGRDAVVKSGAAVPMPDVPGGRRRPGSRR